MNGDSMHIAADSGIDPKLVVEGSDSEKTEGEQRRTSNWHQRISLFSWNEERQHNTSMRPRHFHLLLSRWSYVAADRILR